MAFTSSLMESVFDLVIDPHEQHDLATARPDLRREGAVRLAEWHTAMMQTMPEGYATNPLWTVMREGRPYHARGRLQAYCRRLEETGRGWAIAELLKRHPRDAKHPALP